ncbi:MAG: transcription antitermination factor NusB [Nitrosomonadales bacterium]|nr:transcription antitermination factor NusB [Nitrosomonadales bacterium]
MSEAKQSNPARSVRHRARELAMQGIYEWRLSGKSAALIEKATRDEKSLGRYDSEFFGQLLHGVIAQNEELAAQIAPHLDRAVKELSPVEYSVLLLGTYELTRHPEVPYRVVINEAVELAKTFGGSDGHKFVNGVLDKLAAQVRAAEVKAK